jgi:hypothetical protein
MEKMQKKSVLLWERFLTEKAELLASKMRLSEEKALRAIKRAESSRRLFPNFTWFDGETP